MKRHTKSAVLDISIHEDQLEHDRIRLEHNLQHTDLSLHLSSHDDDTVEYPRHNHAPSAFPDFISFDHHDTSNFDPDTHSQIHAWSYRTADDEDGVSPYGGETVSTAAHHASALTLSAGLGGRGARRDISLSGAEYDPDRPLHHMMAAVDPKLSMFDMDPSRSRYDGAAFDSFHSAGQLDRILQSGHAPPSSRSRSVRIRSPHSSNTSSASSDSDSPRPRLADALQRVSFSPKRPRSPHAPHHPNHRHAQVPPSPLTRAIDDSNAPTPRPPRRSATPAAAAAHSPPTPASQSQFTRAARGLTRDLVEEQQQQQQPHDRNPFTDIANRVVEGGDATRRSSKSRVYLPDVTGLTSAVESPAKAGGGYNAYAADDRPRDSEARLLSTLSVVQTKLHQLEDENGISRRRVRELELELEVCKREVARERTRVLELNEASAIQREADHAHAHGRAAKGKAKARAGLSSVHEAEEEDIGERYREVVEEKKALESLIATLRSHLTRLTSELSSHQELLTELRKLRDRDARTLREKGAEVDRLRREVERLAGEVEVLRGVVEEGLRERALRRETSVTEDVDVDVGQAPGDVGMSEDLETSEEEEEYPPQQSESEDGEGEGAEPPFDDRSFADGSEDEEDEDAEPFDPLSIMGSSRENVGAGGGLPADRTMRTDIATRGSTPFDSNSNLAPRRLSDDERARMAEEIEQRAPNLSGGSGSVGGSFRSRASTPPPPARRQHKQTQTQTSRRATVENVSDEGTEVPRVPSPPPRAGPSQLRRPAVPTPLRARGHNHTRDRSADEDPSNDGAPETPFPQIRGAHLERLFFSAPEHDARTCTVCGRRRGRGVGGGLEGRARAREWVPSRMEREFRARIHEAESDDDEEVARNSEKRAGKRRERDPDEERDYEAVARKAGLPPQTIVARVIRELEDDFTHYKSVYVELADQYKEMDAVSDVPKRNMLAKHLREVVDILEQKGDQIASLYECLTFKDKPLNSLRRPS
ncbi:hypothetical protein C8F04DRAFT_1361591 [Mycena alexandri]|uniref:Cep57 centrosome microtubule-binding domain-containing protein n=1 Tax=Mycena alexandri TaxID=1745969 RepID=A0AAD6X9B8_9AGAR|nr:hypothetical protein C8F04DRAFT_1361591 [Mycena alexandri]